MRGLLLLAVGATLVPLISIFAPHLLKQLRDEKPAAIAASAPMDEATIESAEQEMQEHLQTTNAAAIRPSFVDSQSAMQPEPAAPQKKAPLRRLKRAPSRAEGLPPAPNLTPATADKKSQKSSTLVASASGKLSPFQQRNFSDPMQNRWIDDLSGQKASVSMGMARLERDCQATTVGCERREAPREARLVGVVMESERVIATPTKPLEGKIMRGHYQRETPAVYVK